MLKKVGVEPTGEAFNAIVLDEASNRPFNPMVNAGAIATADLINGKDYPERVSRLLAMFSRYCGRDVYIDNTVFMSERVTGHRNRAIGHLMLNFGMVSDRIPDSLELYFQQCSIMVNSHDLAMIGATLANGGVNPITGERAIQQQYVKYVLSIMHSCGMYDYAGEWAYRVGMPAKSGVGGGIVGVVPGPVRHRHLLAAARSPKATASAASRSAKNSPNASACTASKPNSPAKRSALSSRPPAALAKQPVFHPVVRHLGPGYNLRISNRNRPELQLLVCIGPNKNCLQGVFMCSRIRAAAFFRTLAALLVVASVLCVLYGPVASAADLIKKLKTGPSGAAHSVPASHPMPIRPPNGVADKNIKWKVELPGAGSSTPIIWGDQIFIHAAIPTGRKIELPADPPADAPAESKSADSKPTDGKDASATTPPAATPPAAKGPPGGKGMFGIEKPDEFYQFVLMSLDRKTGQEQWRKTVAEVVPHEGHHPDHGYASYSPVTDGTLRSFLLGFPRPALLRHGRET